LLDFFVHPALFWCFGRKQAEEQMAAGEYDELDEHFDLHPTTQPGVKGEA
jgi:hypothetical protein